VRVSGRGVQLDEAGPAAPLATTGSTDAVDVCFDGRRVWSFSPSRDADHDGWVAWPPALRPFLDGRADVSLAAYGTAHELFRGEVRFGTGEGRVRVVDRSGYPVSVDKAGRLQKTFTQATVEERQELARAAAGVVEALTEACGLDAYLNYGSLLGAVRAGHLIGHDSDVDLGYYSRFTHPFDIVREQRAAVRTLRRRGWWVVRLSGANLKVWLPQDDGRRTGIDVFGSFHIGDRFHVMGSMRGVLDPAAILPFGETTLEGVRFPAPRDTDAFLTYLYGPSWRTPDPAFSFDHPVANVRRMDGWFRGQRHRVRHWERFYVSADLERLPESPSLFAQWVHERAEKAPIADLGCGNGRDAIWFADLGHPVRAYEYSNRARELTDRVAARRGVAVHGQKLNLEDTARVLRTGAGLAREPQPWHVYARGLLDVLAPSGRANLWRLASMAGRRGGQTYVEFRTPRSRGEPKYFGAHPRSYLVPERVVDEIQQHGGTVTERLVGRGLAPLGAEDPHICRLVVRWTR
jgi:SAM-dependent methyltransferase